MNYKIHHGTNQYNTVVFDDNKTIKAWNKNVPFEDGVYEQAHKLLLMPFVKQVCLMPDAHVGMGSTVGSVVSMKGAIIPATVGVDIGCGMRAAKTSLKRDDLCGYEDKLFNTVSHKIPHGRTNNGGDNDRGRWGAVPQIVLETWKKELLDEYKDICEKNCIHSGNKVSYEHLGTLGTGNHFISFSVDEDNSVWLMCHSGSRGVGARIGSLFTKRAKELADIWFLTLPDKNLAYFPHGTKEYDDYLQAAKWSQKFAFLNRKLMTEAMVQWLIDCIPVNFKVEQTFDCHHNYVDIENHSKENVLVTRKGAIRAREEDFGVIPGSMGQRSYIIQGKGSQDSLCSCSHGAGRKMSRTEAKKTISLEEHIKDTEGVFCDKSKEVLDESPQAYKNIDNVIEAECDLVNIKAILKEFICIKGLTT